jgi:hypothetical protein
VIPLRILLLLLLSLLLRLPQLLQPQLLPLLLPLLLLPVCLLLWAKHLHLDVYLVDGLVQIDLSHGCRLTEV